MEIDFEEVQDVEETTQQDVNETTPQQDNTEEGGEKVPSDWMTIFGPFDLGCPIRNEERQRSRRYQRYKS